MNLGADAWRNHLEGRIAETIERYEVDAYFLDIVGGHVNSTNGDMHEGTRRLVKNLREKHPSVAPVGEMPYDALHGFIPMYQAGFSPRWLKYSRYYPAPEQPGAGAGQQRRARIGILEVRRADVEPDAGSDPDAAGGGRHVHQAPIGDGRDHRIGKDAGASGLDHRAAGRDDGPG